MLRRPPKPRLLAIIGSGLLLAGAACAQAADFRHASWGMSKDEVMRGESSPPLQENDTTLFYRTQLAGMAAVVVYQFEGDALYRTAYLIGAGYSAYEPSIADYRRVEAYLEQKYGAGNGEQTIWARADAQGNYVPSDYDRAVTAGHLILNARWNTSSATVGLLLGKGGPLQRRMTIAYQAAQPPANDGVHSPLDDL